MNKIGFFLSGILSIFGLVLYVVTRIVNLVLPKIGYAAYQIAKKGSYTPNNYIIDFSMIRIIAAVLIFIGFVLSMIFYIAELRGSKKQ